jgi:hypothetical protein
MADNKDLVFPQFKILTTKNDAKSKEKGRPIYDDLEVCEIRMAANKQTVAVFPAHEVSGWVDGEDGTRIEQTYAMRYPEQYKKFKAGEAQAMSGTPLEELPFLTQSKRMELKALNIYTAEALSMLDGQNLKLLGIGGRELKNQAIAYLDNASGSADVTKLASDNVLLKDQIAELREQMAALQKQAVPPQPSVSAFDDWADADLKDHIEKATGARPRGNPSHATLVGMANSLEQAAA